MSKSNAPSRPFAEDHWRRNSPHANWNAPHTPRPRRYMFICIILRPRCPAPIFAHRESHCQTLGSKDLSKWRAATPRDRWVSPVACRRLRGSSCTQSTTPIAGSSGRATQIAFRFPGRPQVSRKIGIPLTRSGRQRKIGRMTGCCIPLAIMMGGGAAALGWLVA
jgi:hypothetical protein